MPDHSLFQFNGYGKFRTRPGDCACRRGAEPGLSARAILFGSGPSPSDPSDLCRCLEVSPSAPEHMRGRSAEWTTLVDHWDELAALLHEEHPTGVGVRTYARMRELFADARAGDA